MGPSPKNVLRPPGIALEFWRCFFANGSFVGAIHEKAAQKNDADVFELTQLNIGL